MSDPHNSDPPAGQCNDVSSKIHKSLPTPSAADDEYNTIFTKRLFECDGMNSTSHDDHEFDTITDSADDATKLNTAKDIAANHDAEDHVDSWQPHQPISLNPSASSRGFENTFKVLEQQICGKTALNRQQSANFLRRSNLHSNPIFVNVSCGRKERFLRAISEEEDDHGSSSCRSNDDAAAACAEEEQPEARSFLELELDARQRIRELSERSAMASSSSLDTWPNSRSYVDTTPTLTDNCGCSSMTEFLYGISTHDRRTSQVESNRHEMTEADVQQVAGEYPEYVYHMARGKDGQKYLRVMRSKPADKGMCEYGDNYKYAGERVLETVLQTV